MIWYLQDLLRFRDERQGLIALGDAEWLTPIGLRTDERMHVIFDADIVVGSRTFEVSLHYPHHFPTTPPRVLPRGDVKTRWSGHQFGPGGELCLEYGPDNWTPDMTGAQMLESAHRLLALEAVAPEEGDAIPSRHVNTLGQELRGSVFRIVLTRELLKFFESVAVGTSLSGKSATAYRLTTRDESQIFAYVEKVTVSEQETWRDKSIPAALGYELWDGEVVIARVPEGATAPPATNIADFDSTCAAHGLPAIARNLILLCGDKITAYYVLRATGSVGTYDLVPSPVDQQRLNSDHVQLKQKKVAVIGCGSLGSKIATTLARCGVGSFVLLDDDVLQPGNLVRNELDWRDMGAHKVDALARRVQYVNPEAKVSVRRMQLAGQESAGLAEFALDQISRFDLIIDATANPEVFNLLSAVATGDKKALLWAEVFGGGIGGLIARCRPELEPPPQYMRRAIENWFAEQNAEPVRATRNYETGAKEAPLIADDADVSSIAAAASRLAVDTLLRSSPSLFPHSAYAIGLAPGSVFTQPLQNFPIDVGALAATVPANELSDEEKAAELTEIVKLFDKK